MVRINIHIYTMSIVITTPVLASVRRDTRRVPLKVTLRVTIACYPGRQLPIPDEDPSTTPHVAHDVVVLAFIRRTTKSTET
jgi:hypothetical protein